MRTWLYRSFGDTGIYIEVVAMSTRWGVRKVMLPDGRIIVTTKDQLLETVA